MHVVGVWNKDGTTSFSGVLNGVVEIGLTVNHGRLPVDPLILMLETVRP